MKRRRKPDFLFILAIIVGVGVILTMRVQAGAQTSVPSANAPAHIVAQSAAVR